MVRPVSDEQMAETITAAASDLAVAVHAIIQKHPLGQGEFGSLVRRLGVMYLAEMEAKGAAELGHDAVSREFRGMMLKPLRRAVGKLQGPTN